MDSSSSFIVGLQPQTPLTVEERGGFLIAGGGTVSIAITAAEDFGIRAVGTVRLVPAAEAGRPLQSAVSSRAAVALIHTATINATGGMLSLTVLKFHDHMVGVKYRVECIVLGKNETTVRLTSAWKVGIASHFLQLDLRDMTGGKPGYGGRWGDVDSTSEATFHDHVWFNQTVRCRVRTRSTNAGMLLNHAPPVRLSAPTREGGSATRRLLSLT